jgi:flagellar hook-basal body complex protein FliE
MNEISPQQLLTQIRAMNAELLTPLTGEVKTTDGSGFSELFANAINKVNDTQMTAGVMKRDFEIDQSDAGLAEVMVAAQKADLSFRAMTEVRNKLITSYQEIMNMPV